MEEQKSKPLTAEMIAEDLDAVYKQGGYGANDECVDVYEPFSYTSRIQKKAGIPHDFIMQRLIKRVGAEAACVYVLLDWHKDDETGECCSRTTTLMFYSGFKAKVLRNALSTLEDAGLVCTTKKRRVSKRTGREYGYRINHYKLL